MRKEIDRQAARVGKVQEILVEVNIGDETSKSGIAPEQLVPLLEEVATFQNLKVKGLMTIRQPEKMRNFYQKCKIYILTFAAKTWII